MMSSLNVLQLRLKALAQHPEPAPSAFLDLDREFHTIYVVAAGRPRPVALHATLGPQLERYAVLYSEHIGGQFANIVDEDAAILKSLTRREGAAAREAVIRNWQSGAVRLAAIIERSGVRGDWPGGAR